MYTYIHMQEDVTSEVRQRVNKVKHLNRVNGNINTS